MLLAKYSKPVFIFVLFFSLPALSVFAAGPFIVSVDSSSNQSNGESARVSQSNDGRFVAFASTANNLVDNDSNGSTDVFRHDTTTGETIRVSVTSDGAQLNSWSIRPRISGDGNLIIFESSATNISQNDNNGQRDVFLHDTTTGNTVLISKTDSGVAGNDYSEDATISANGRYIVFASAATNLAPNDTTSLGGLFMYDTATESMTRICVSLPPDATCGKQQISADGRYVTFSSDANNLVPDDANQNSDVFLRDNLTGSTTIVSVSSSEDHGNDYSGSFYAPVSDDGRYVAFNSYATNLVINDENSYSDIYLRDMLLGITTRMTTNAAGVEADGPSYDVDMSSDGQYVVFTSNASNLVTDDNNTFQDYFVRDTTTGGIGRINVSASGEEANIENFNINNGLSISADGQSIAFVSGATNLVENDNNSQIDVFVRSLPLFEVPPEEMTPEEQAVALVDEVLALTIPNNIENSYLANLYKVEAFIEGGQTIAAINQLNAFINKVNQDYNQNKITQQIRNDLIAAAENLIDNLTN